MCTAGCRGGAAAVSPGEDDVKRERSPQELRERSLMRSQNQSTVSLKRAN